MIIFADSRDLILNSRNANQVPKTTFKKPWFKLSNRWESYREERFHFTAAQLIQPNHIRVAFTTTKYHLFVVVALINIAETLIYFVCSTCYYGRWFESSVID